MGILGKVLESFTKGQKSMQREDLPDDVTTDRVLRGLRRERRIQMEKVEKEHLKKKIANFKREETRKELWGIHNAPPIRGYGPSKNVKGNNGVFSERMNIGGKTMGRKRKTKSKNQSFMGKGKI